MIAGMPLTHIVKHLIIINVLTFFGTTLVMGEAVGVPSTEVFTRDWLALYMPGSPNFRPYQIATHMFMHGNLGHLFFNMFSLYMFGPQVEMVWGEKRFLFYYLFCALGAAALQLAVNYWSMQQGGVPLGSYYGSMWGASGAIFGIYAAYAYLFPDNRLMLLFPPVELKAKWFVLIIAIMELSYGVAGSNLSSVAHFAHVGGALFGLILIWYWRGFRLGRY